MRRCFSFFGGQPTDRPPAPLARSGRLRQNTTKNAVGQHDTIFILPAVLAARPPVAGAMIRFCASWLRCWTHTQKRSGEMRDAQPRHHAAQLKYCLPVRNSLLRTTARGANVCKIIISGVRRLRVILVLLGSGWPLSLIQCAIFAQAALYCIV